ncbi:MAG: hypothetical protein KKG04_03850 [Candidatus Thermoplasmatota archaeon]|nr:hypothetical protein [Candidatus Thermoplasmatota archaeon]
MKEKARYLLICLFAASMILLMTISDVTGLKADGAVRDKHGYHNVTIFKELDSVGTYEEYLASREDKPCDIRSMKLSRLSDDSLILIFIAANIVPLLSDELDQYGTTLEGYGFNPIFFEISGGTAEDIKNQILVYWNNGSLVSGCVLIGDLPCEWFHHEDDFYGPAEFPCDLFLMDLDGSWIDTDSNGMYDSHIDGTGDTAPEIYVGRIDASKIPGDEITVLRKYFAKIQDFWRGVTNQTKIGLTYTDNDWASGQSFRYDLGYAYESFEAVWYPDVFRDDYVNNRIPGTYEFIQLSCHSSYAGHSFESGGWAYSNDIRYAPPKALFYNLFCCSSLRFTENNCLGYAYIMNTDTPSLSVVGSTKTGSMLDFRYFYEPIGLGASFGDALQQWFEYEYPYSTDDISWFYGMTILGDPTLIINCQKNLPPQCGDITGPTEGFTDKTYSFCANITDSENNSIYALWDWGDDTSSNWLGPYSAGDEICATHAWNQPGVYTIHLRLKDETGALSGWSGGHNITIVQGPLLELRNIDGGLFTVSTRVKNIGSVIAEEVEWSIQLNGGIILGGKKSLGTISNISSGETVIISSDPIFGFGKIQIEVTAEIPNSSVFRIQHATLLLFFIYVLPSGGLYL